jgi:dUTP pyrophosphatase
MKKLGYYKLHEDGFDPVYATAGSACFDIRAYFKETLYEKDEVKIKVYTMDNKEEQRECKCYAMPKNTFQVCVNLDPGERICIPTGLIFKIPVGNSVRIHPRSSVSLKKGLIIPNGVGIIDSDYYHETFVMLYNGSADTIRIGHGDRIAQGELVESVPNVLEEVTKQPGQTTERIGGFGSTGV